MKSKSVKLNPLLIDTTAGTQSRHSIRQSTIDEYAEDMRNGDLFPQIIVYAEEGSDRYILADGFKRHSAHIAARPGEEISVDLREGGILEAKKYAAGANFDHGERRTPMDVRHCIRMVLLEEEWTDLSNNAIAKMTRTNTKTVAKVREDMTIAGEIGNSGKRKHVRADGTEVTTTVPKQTGTSKKKKKDKKNGKEAPANTGMSQDTYDRDDIIRALDTLKSTVCSGAEALERYKLHAHYSDAKIAHEFLGELIEETDKWAAGDREKAGDEDAFLTA